MAKYPSYGRTHDGAFFGVFDADGQRHKSDTKQKLKTAPQETPKTSTMPLTRTLR